MHLMRISHLALLLVSFCSVTTAYALPPIACTMDAKLCSDGVTYVGRDGSRNCQWQLCPGESDACVPYVCNDGTHVNKCTQDGTVINYFAAPCLTHGGEIETGEQSFFDVPFTHANAEAIAYVKLRGIVEGYADGTFRPDQSINRAEFTKIVTLYKFGQVMIDMCNTHIRFFDVSASAWYGKYICRAQDAGLVEGYSNGAFLPAENIDFDEAAKIIVLADVFGNPDNDLAVYGAEDPWYERYVRYLAERKAIPMSINRLDFPIKRGEMAEMIWRLDAQITTKPSQRYESLLPSH